MGKDMSYPGNRQINGWTQIGMPGITMATGDRMGKKDGNVRNILCNFPNCVVQFLYTVHNTTIDADDKGAFPPEVLIRDDSFYSFFLC